MHFFVLDVPYFLSDLLLLFLSKFFIFIFLLLNIYVWWMIWLILRVFWIIRSVVWWTSHWLAKLMLLRLGYFEHFWIIAIRNLKLVIRLLALMANAFWPWFDNTTLRFINKLFLLRWSCILAFLNYLRVTYLIIFYRSLLLIFLLILNILLFILYLLYIFCISGFYFNIILFKKNFIINSCIFLLSIIISSKESFQWNIRFINLSILWLIKSVPIMVICNIVIVFIIIKSNDIGFVVLLIFIYPPFLTFSSFVIINGPFSVAHVRIWIISFTIVILMVIIIRSSWSSWWTMSVSWVSMISTSFSIVSMMWISLVVIAVIAILFILSISMIW